MMRKRILHFAMFAGLALVIPAIAGIAMVRSAAFHRYALAKMIQKASEATGARIEIGDYRFHLAGLAIDLDRIVLHGTESSPHPPLLQIDHLRVGLKIISIWSRKINLSEIVVDHPSIHFSVDAKGKSNLPAPQGGSSGGAGTSIFDLAIGNFAIHRGELQYNDRSLPLEAEVRDLEAKVDYSLLKSEYDGELNYRDGRVTIGDFNPIVHGLQASFAAAPSGIKIDSLKLSEGKSAISVQAQIHDYANPTIDGSYQGSVFTRELGEILKVESMPAGQVDVKGSAHFQNRNGHSTLESFSSDGDFRSAVVAVNLPQAHVDIRSASGKFILHDATLEVKDAKANLLNGSAKGNLKIVDLGGRAEAKVAAEFRRVQIGAVTSALNSPRNVHDALNVKALRSSPVTGSVDGAVTGSWEGAGQKLNLRADAKISAAAGASAAADAGQPSIPVHGEIHVVYDDPTGTLTVRNSRLATPHTTATFDGTAGKRSSLALSLQSGDLHEVDMLTLMVRRAFSSKATPPEGIALLGLAGSGSFSGQLRGASGQYELSGQLDSTNFKYHDAALNLLHANVDLSPSRIALSQGQLRPVTGGQATFSGSTQLTDWSYKPQNPVQVDLTASGIQVATVEGAAGLHYPVSGTLTGHASLQGTQTDLKGSGNLAFAQGTAWQQPYQNLAAQFQIAGQTLHSTLQLATPAGSGTGDVKYDLSSQSYDAQLNLPNLQLEQLNAVTSRELPISGSLNASLQGKGTLKQPQLAAILVASNLTAGRQTFNGLQLRGAIVNGRANFVLESSASGASINGSGTVDLGGDYPIQATLDMKNISLGAILGDVLTQVPPELAGQAELHAALHGPLREKNLLEGEIDVPKLNLAYKTLQIGNLAPIHAVYRGGVISLEPCELKGTGTDVKLRAALPLGRDNNLQAVANGTVDFRLIALALPRWNGSGTVQLDVNAAGTRAHPQVNGTLRFDKVGMEGPDSPIGVENVNGVIAVKNGRMEIQSFKGEAGGGTFTAQGFANYQPAMQYNLGLTARRVRLRYPVGTRTVLNGNLMLTGNDKSGVMSGQLTVDRLSLTKDFDLATFADQFGTISVPSSGPSFARNIKINVSLKSAREMALASNKLSVQGSADLVIRGTVAEPVLLGRTTITGGEIFFGGNRYTVESGVVQFVNPLRTEPVVNILVTTTVNQFDLSMNFMGPIDRLRTTYTSDPPLAPVDIINLITTGHTTEASTAGQTSPESVIAGQLTGQVSSRVEKLAGVSSLTIDPQVGGTQGGGGGKLAVQQRVTKNLFFTFSTDLRTSTGQTVQVEYQVSKKFALSTTRDQNGGYTVQVKVHKRF